jgi:hypothetical protein
MDRRRVLPNDSFAKALHAALRVFSALDYPSDRLPDTAGSTCRALVARSQLLATGSTEKHTSSRSPIPVDRPEVAILILPLPVRLAVIGVSSVHSTPIAVHDFISSN